MRCSVTSETCVIDDHDYYVRGSLEVPVQGTDDLISYGLWVSLGKQNFERYVELLHVKQRDHEGPFFAWLSDPVPTYPPFEHLKSRIHLRNGIRPYIELEPTDYPLAVEQREGASPSRVQKLFEWVESRASNG